MEKNMNEYVVEEKKLDSKATEERQRRYFESLNEIRKEKEDNDNGKL